MQEVRKDRVLFCLVCSARFNHRGKEVMMLETLLVVAVLGAFVGVDKYGAIVLQTMQKKTTQDAIRQALMARGATNITEERIDAGFGMQAKLPDDMTIHVRIMAQDPAFVGIPGQQKSPRNHTCLTLELHDARIPADLTLAKMHVDSSMSAALGDEEPGMLPQDVAVGGSYETTSREWSEDTIDAIRKAISEDGWHLDARVLKLVHTGLLTKQDQYETRLAHGQALFRALMKRYCKAKKE